MDVAGFQSTLRVALAAARERIAAFRSLPPDVPAREVLARFDRMLAPLNGLAGRVGLFVGVHPDEAVRSACEALERELAQLATELSLDRGVYERLAACSPEALAASEEQRLLEHGLRDFHRSGVDRDEPTRARLRALKDELIAIGQDFDRNIVTGGREFVVQDGHAGLAGLPPDFLASHPERGDGTVLLSTDPSDRIPMLTYAARADVRREYFRAAMNRAVPANLEVLPRLIAKRHELATLLGYAHYADYVTEDKMTKSAAEARAFVERVAALVRERALAERDELLAAKRTEEPGAQSVGEWERLYWTERVKRARFGFDSQSVRPYFAYERVKDGVLSVSAALYGVRFRKDETRARWHSAVECYEILEGSGAGERVVARFWLDMHPRPNKYKHAAMFHLAEGVSGGIAGATEDDTLAEACLVCNFPEPKDGDPALLLHDQVTTFFHEFGHLLHHLFAGRQTWLSFSGIATEHDFVEVPSQMYEEWAWDPAVLATFARHHETGAPIPAALVRELRRAEEYGKGMHVLTQMTYALLSLTLYDRDPAGLDPLEEMRRVRAEHAFLEPDPENRFVAAFGHLHGYSAMYYTYMWSLVIAKDVFGAFGDDLMDGATADRYRQTILAPGGTKDADALVVDFLGREYGFEAFARWLAV